jgi:hypothetical protein
VGALSGYQQQLQTLLHDSLGQQWPVSTLPAYINEARNRVAQDTKALRMVLLNSQFPTMVFAQGTEFITPQTFLPAPYGGQLIDTLGISITVNQQRLKLIQKPYTWLDAWLRSWVNYQQWPQFFAVVSPIQIVIAPVPNINYTCDWDVSLNPNPLVDDTTLEQIPAPFTEPVQYYAAYKAKLTQQSQGEAKMFFDLYQQNLRLCARAYMQRIVPNPYATTV